MTSSKRLSRASSTAEVGEPTGQEPICIIRCRLSLRTFCRQGRKHNGFHNALTGGTRRRESRPDPCQGTILRQRSSCHRKQEREALKERMFDAIKRALGLTPTTPASQEQGDESEEVEVYGRPFRELEEGESLGNVAAEIVVVPKGCKPP